MITFEDARLIALQHLADDRYTIGPSGWENESSYQVVREQIDDTDIVLDDGPSIIVDKETGEYTEVWGLQDDGYPYKIPNPTEVVASM